MAFYKPCDDCDHTDKCKECVVTYTERALKASKQETQEKLVACDGLQALHRCYHTHIRALIPLASERACTSSKARNLCDAAESFVSAVETDMKAFYKNRPVVMDSDLTTGMFSGVKFEPAG